MRRTGFLFLLLALQTVLPAADDLPPEQFMDRVRYSRSGRSMAALSGIMQYKKAGAAMETLPVYLGLLIEPEQVRGQLLLNDLEEYRMKLVIPAGQSAQVQRSVRIVRPGTDGKLRLQQYGLLPDDLMMGFLYYPFRKELSGTLVKGLPCRVMVLSAPDGKEAVRVYLLKAHYFPIKAEFFAGEADAAAGKNPRRTLEIGSFQQQNKLYYAQVINILGPDWRSRVTFDKAALSIPPAGAQPPFRNAR